MKKYILAIDEGTTSVRAILFDVEKNKIVKLSRQPITIVNPRVTWVEQDANDIWNKTLKCLKDVTSNIDLDDVYGLGITNQRETTIAWEKNSGKPLYNAIVWNDRRTINDCYKLIKSKHSKIIQDKTGLIINSYFSATKMKWLLHHVPAVAKAAKANNLCLGTMESFLVYKLTQHTVFVTDVTNASRTMLFNINSCRWDNQLLNIFGINKKWLARPVDNDKKVGFTTLLGKKLAIVGLIGDQQSSLLGQGCFHKGDIKNTYGTGCFMLANTGTQRIRSVNNLLTTIACRINNKTYYALEGSIFSGGSLINGMIAKKVAKNHRQLAKLAKKVKSTNTYLIPAFKGLGAPHWLMEAQPQFINWDKAENKDKAYAAYHALVMRNQEVFNAIKKDTKYSFKRLCVDGGLAMNKYLMHKQADVLQLPISIINLESTAMGAITLTGLATQAFKSLYKLEYKPIKTYKVKKPYKKVVSYINDWNDLMSQYMKGK